MDLRAVAELVLMASVGVTMITIAIGFTTRVFLGPILRDVADRFASRPTMDEGRLLMRVELLEERLTAIESGLDRIEAAQDFDRRLGTIGPRKTDTA